MSASLCFIVSFTLTISQVHSGVQNIFIPDSEIQSVSIYSNLEVTEEKIPVGSTFCGYGKSMVFLMNDGACSTSESFDVPFGAVNTLITDANRRNYADQTVTFIHQDFLTEVALGDWTTAVKGLSRGDTECGNFAVLQFGTFEKIGQYTYRLGIASSIKTDEDSICCSLSNGLCTSYQTSGTSTQTLVCSCGSGLKGVLYGPTEYPGSRKLEQENLPTRFPSESEVVDKRLIATDYPTYIKTAFIHKESRKKRFVSVDGSAALALATANRVDLDSLIDHTNSQFYLVDQDIQTLFKRVKEQALYNVRQSYEILASNTHQKITDLTLSLQSDIISSLDEKVDAVSNFVDYFVRFQNSRTEDDQKSYEEAISLVSGNVLSHERLELGYLFKVQTGEHFVDTNVTKVCEANQCEIDGVFNYYKDYGVVEEVSNPVLNIYTCGVFVYKEDVGSEALKEVISVQRVVELCEDWRCAWVNRVKCLEGFPTLSNHWAQTFRQKFNVNITLIKPGLFTPNCSGKLPPYSSFCQKLVDINTAKTTITQWKGPMFRYKKFSGGLAVDLGGLVDLTEDFFDEAGNLVKPIGDVLYEAMKTATALSEKGLEVMEDAWDALNPFTSIFSIGFWITVGCIAVLLFGELTLFKKVRDLEAAVVAEKNPDFPDEE